jgi:hypothetical protein
MPKDFLRTTESMVQFAGALQKLKHADGEVTLDEEEANAVVWGLQIMNGSSNKENDMEQDTKIGHIVHYVSYGTPKGEYSEACRAAMVTELHPGYDDPTTLGLAVLNPTGLFFDRNIRHAAEPRGGTWHRLDECKGLNP